MAVVFVLFFHHALYDESCLIKGGCCFKQHQIQRDHVGTAIVLGETGIANVKPHVLATVRIINIHLLDGPANAYKAEAIGILLSLQLSRCTDHINACASDCLSVIQASRWFNP